MAYPSLSFPASSAPSLPLPCLSAFLCVSVVDSVFVLRSPGGGVIG